MRNVDYLFLLQAIRDLPHSVGKKTLLDIVQGKTTKRIVASDHYLDLEAYGKLEQYSGGEIQSWIDKLVSFGMLQITSPPGKPYWKVLEITSKGLREIHDPSLHKQQERITTDKPSENTQELIQAFASQLSTYNNEQQHAIVAPEKRIRCIAGAGAGKTTVLTQRVKFLVHARGVDAREILAITFTRKARAEMQRRLEGIPVTVLTFNGLCQRILNAAHDPLTIATYGEKAKSFREAAQKEDINLYELAHDYFSSGQRNGSSQEELARRLMHDVYSILDHYSNEDAPLPRTGPNQLATQLLTLARTTRAQLQKRNKRTYSGQLKDALKLIREYPELIPQYTHVLVDEYQDVNTAQVELLKLIDPENLFVVGDPRQSIFGWRGSHVEFILDFQCEATIQLTKNYRSTPEVVNLMNTCIGRMGLAPLEAAKESGPKVQFLSFAKEEEERASIAALLTSLQAPTVFVLARTNKQLEELSALLTRKKISHNIRHEEDEQDAQGIVLSTVHAIKGLEAHTVIVLGATNRYFPIKVGDHPVVDLLKDTHLDKEAEELRLLYVALSRAEHTLIVSHSGDLTYLLEGVAPGAQPQGRDDVSFEKLRKWRGEQAGAKNLPAYCILTDKTLRNLTEVKPQTLSELRYVHGMGDAKIRQFGEEVLDILHS